MDVVNRRRMDKEQVMRELINTAKRAIELMENEEDVWCRNSTILREFREVVDSLRNAVIEAESKTVENSALYSPFLIELSS